ncbi:MULTISPECIES: YHYH domain-containing protein [Rhizobium]|nr:MULTISPECIES: YHYH domain-containing protein [Rhizobium]
MKLARIALTATVLALSAISAFGHGGGLDKNGCHTNHKTGDYHCH